MVRVFDWSTRAVYDETTSASVGTMALRWASEARGKSKKKLTQTNRGIGASKLQAMALRACVLNLEFFTVETLQSVQWYYAGKIYRECQERSVDLMKGFMELPPTFQTEHALIVIIRQALSYNDWFLFKQAFSGHIDSHHQFSFFRSNKEHDLVTREIPHICGKLTKLNTENLSLLLLSQVDISFDHLISLTKIPNLSGLCLTQRRGAFSSRDQQQHIKHWARHARDCHALGRLEILYMANFSVDTQIIMDAASSFPYLHLIGVTEDLGHVTHSSSFVTSSDTWHQCRIDSRLYGGNSKPRQDFCPSECWNWTVPSTSEQAKIRKILEFSRVLRNDTELPEPSVSITYGEATSSARSYTTSKWFVRSRHTRQEENLKRDHEEELNTRTKNVKKRRTVRTGKQADVASLLGQFS